MEKDFLNVWSKLEIENVNEISLFITLEGSVSSLKPNIVSAHQDVVPVDNANLGSWTHEPYSDGFNGTYIWGRRYFDNKNMIMVALQAVEYIFKNEPDFKSNRTVILIYGADEEVSGRWGAR